MGVNDEGFNMSDMACPHCEYEWDDDGGEWSYIEKLNPYRSECPQCDKPIEVYIEWDPVYYISKCESAQ